MIKNFFSGISFLKRGFGFVTTHKSLLKYIFIPLLINLVLFVCLGFLLYHYYTPLYTHLNQSMGSVITTGGGWLNSILAGVLWFFSGVLRVLLALVLLALMILALYILSQIINSPFYDLISEATEKIVLGKPESPATQFWQQILPMVALETKKMAFFVMVPFLLLILNIIPFLGAVLYTLSANLFIAWGYGFNYLSYPLTRRLIPFAGQIKLSLTHKSELVGFGLPFMIPFFNLLFAPFAVVGGTLLYLEKMQPKEIDF